MAHDLFRSSNLNRHSACNETRIFIRLDLNTDTVVISYSFPELRADLPHDTELISVRIEAAGVPADLTPAPAQPAAPGNHAVEPIKPEYSEEACRAWFRLRIHSWPKGIRTPTAPQCLAAARAFFNGKIARDRFYDLRNEVVPEGWRRKGRPRIRNIREIGGRNSAS
jgi:hypothetical protein